MLWYLFRVQWGKMRGNCCFCWYWFNSWPSLFKLSFHNDSFNWFCTCWNWFIFPEHYTGFSPIILGRARMAHIRTSGYFCVLFNWCILCISLAISLTAFLCCFLFCFLFVCFSFLFCLLCYMQLKEALIDCQKNMLMS